MNTLNRAYYDNGTLLGRAPPRLAGCSGGQEVGEKICCSLAHFCCVARGSLDLPHQALRRILTAAPVILSIMGRVFIDFSQ